MSELFIPGQRWVSHADSTLGLGIVTQADERRVTLHFPAVEEERVYAIDRAPLTRLLLKKGDRLTRIDGTEMTVTAVQHRSGVMTYEAANDVGDVFCVTEAELDAHIELNTPIERLINNQLGKLADFDLRRITLEHSAADRRFDLRGLLGARTALLSHQLYVATSVGKRFAPRVLLADEVGLGKTIEAGLILNQQLLLGRANRVLILTPESLAHQWLIEMQRRFHLSFSLLNKQRLEDADPEEEFAENNLIISPLTLFESEGDVTQVVNALDWDMVIVDEAHHITGLTEPRTPLGDFVSTLSGNTKSLLLLTATPEQAGLESHFHRLQLIDPARFTTFDHFQEEQRLYSEWNSTIEQLEAGEQPQLPAGVTREEDPEQQIQQLVDRYGTGRVLYRNTRKGIAGFPQRHLHAHSLVAPELYTDQSGELHPETSHSEEIWIAADPRVRWLEEQLKTLRPQKALVICAHRETAIALEHHLHLRAGVRCAAFHEELTLIERDRAAAYFAEDAGGAQALICSEIGSEGRNFQFAKHLICFDLPSHPDLLEQRIGRLDRIGQGKDIHIHVPYLQATAQEALFKWLDSGLNAFSSTCAVGYQLFAEFGDALGQTLHNDVELMRLIDATSSRRTLLQQESERGRDRLLERNSHNPQRGGEIIAALEARESASELSEFTELLFDRLGIEVDYLEENLSLVRPTENLLTGQLPGLGEDGATATYDRQTALSRDDVMFLTWEHPIVVESMSALLGGDIGKASLGTFKHRGVPGGTVLLEAIHRVECIAPRHLETGRFLDETVFRSLLTPDAREVGDKLSAQFLSEHLQPVPTATSAAALNKLRPVLESVFTELEHRAQQVSAERRLASIQSAQAYFDAEINRLLHLQSINPSISADEVASLSRQKEACLEALKQTAPVLEGLRVCVAV